MNETNVFNIGSSVNYTDTVLLKDLVIVRVTKKILEEFKYDLIGLDTENSSSGYFSYALTEHFDYNDYYYGIFPGNTIFSGIKYLVVDRTKPVGKRILCYFGFSTSAVELNQYTIEKRLSNKTVSRQRDILEYLEVRNVDASIKASGSLSLDYFIIHTEYRGKCAIDGDEEYKLSALLLGQCINLMKELCKTVNCNNIMLYSTDEAMFMYLKQGFLPVLEHDRLSMLRRSTNPKMDDILNSRDCIELCNTWSTTYTVNMSLAEMECVPMIKVLGVNEWK